MCWQWWPIIAHLQTLAAHGHHVPSQLFSSHCGCICVGAFLCPTQDACWSWCSMMPILITTVCVRYSTSWSSPAPALHQWTGSSHCMGSDVGVSYSFILYSIPHIHSTDRRSKLLSTCSLLIMVVSVLFGSETFIYCHPCPVLPMSKSKVSIVFSTIVVLMLNSIIYSFRNKEIKVALEKTALHYLIGLLGRS